MYYMQPISSTIVRSHCLDERATLINRGAGMSVFGADGQTTTMKDCEKMSNEELYRFVKMELPAVAATVREINESNRETVIAFLKFLKTRMP